LNFGIIQTLLMITLVIGAVAVAIVWTARREFQLKHANRVLLYSRTDHQCGSIALARRIDL
jgi:hypothetical protein